MKCSISTYYKILDAELYDFDDGYMQLNVDIDTKNIDLEEYVSMQKKISRRHRLRHKQYSRPLTSTPSRNLKMQAQKYLEFLANVQ